MRRSGGSNLSQQDLDQCVWLQARDVLPTVESKRRPPGVGAQALIEVSHPREGLDVFACLSEEGLELFNRIAPKPRVNVHALYRTVMLGCEANEARTVFDGKRMVLLCRHDERTARSIGTGGCQQRLECWAEGHGVA